MEALAGARSRRLLRLNLDETSLCLHPGRCKGAVFVSPRAAPPVQRVASGARRCCLTHVGVICDDTSLQPLLPQFIIGNERTIKASAVSKLSEACPRCVVLLRRKTAWSNAAVTAMVVRRLARVVAMHEELVGDVQVVLIMDAGRLHYAPEVLKACSECDVWPVYVPAKLTWLLQPLDTDGFALYKACVKKAYQAARARNPEGGGEVVVEEFLQCIYEALRRVLHGRMWGSAFDRDGYGRRQASLGNFVKQQLRWETMEVVADSRPTDAQMRALFPRRAKVPLWKIWAQLDGAARKGSSRLRWFPLRRLPPIAESAAAAALLEDHPSPAYWTRSKARQHRARAAEAAAAASTATSGGPRALARTRAQTRALREAVAASSSAS